MVINFTSNKLNESKIMTWINKNTSPGVCWDLDAINQWQYTPYTLGLIDMFPSLINGGKIIVLSGYHKYNLMIERVSMDHFQSMHFQFTMWSRVCYSDSNCTYPLYSDVCSNARGARVTQKPHIQIENLRAKNVTRALSLAYRLKNSTWSHKKLVTQFLSHVQYFTQAR